MTTHTPTLLIGLGNPGDSYAHTRHNAGFLLCDFLRDTYDFPLFRAHKKQHAEVSEHVTPAGKVILAKPTTFMNNSGRAVRALVDFYKIDPTTIIVAQDDLDIALGSYKITRDRGAAGHNGVIDIIENIGTRNFCRIRIGIDARSEEQRANQPGQEYVLGRFSTEEERTLTNLFPTIAQELSL